MNIYKSSEFDIPIIIICIIIFGFAVTMINLEIEKSKNKYKEAIIGVLILIAIFGVGALVKKYSIFEYLLEVFVFIVGLCILIGYILTFCIYKTKLQYKNKKIEVKHNGTICIILCIMSLIRSLFSDNKEERIMAIFFIVIMLIAIPIDYLINHYVNLYEDGILLDEHSFLKRIIYRKEIISYDKIKNINFLEYEKNKFLLEINSEKDSKDKIYKCKIKKKEKEEMISFISEFIDKKKITTVKEY